MFASLVVYTNWRNKEANADSSIPTKGEKAFRIFVCALAVLLEITLIVGATLSIKGCLFHQGFRPYLITGLASLYFLFDIIVSYYMYKGHRGKEIEPSSDEVLTLIFSNKDSSPPIDIQNPNS